MVATQKISDKLTRLLRAHSKSPPRRLQVPVELLPLNTPSTFEGISLADVFYPEVKGSGRDCRHLYDSWLFGIYDSGTDTRDDLNTAYGGKALFMFISKGESLQEKTVRLLLALARAPGATMEISSRSLMITHDGVEYGIKDGLVVSRFCTGMEMDCDPQAIYKERKIVVIRDETCVTLYREAYRKGCVQPLIALYMGYPKYNFMRLITEGIKTPSDFEMRKITDALNDKSDPVGNLYQRVVPLWMPRREFLRAISNMSVRPLCELSPSHKQRLISALYRYFHYKKTRKA